MGQKEEWEERCFARGKEEMRKCASHEEMGRKGGKVLRTRK